MNKVSSIRVNILLYSLGILMLFILISFYTLNMTNKYKEQIDGIFAKHVQLSYIKEKLIAIDDSLLGFLSSNSSTQLNNYLKNSDTLLEYIHTIPLYTDDKEDLMQKDIINMIEVYIEKAETAIRAKRSRDVNEYSDVYQESSIVKGYINEYVNELIDLEFGKSYNAYTVLSKQIKTIQIITFIMILDVFALIVLIVYLMAIRMIRPIMVLAQSAEEIAQGNFEFKDIEISTHDELSLLATAFNKMKSSIRLYIAEQNMKSETEAKLKDQQMANLKMQNLLDNARLYALQSQINPHFLFNTINAGVQMALLEGADRTSEFLESMSRIFRYNIKKMDSEVTLQEEINNIKDYYELLKVRFGSMITFKFSIDPNALNVKMPPLVLQPLSENAYIHGLSSKEEGGTIIIKAINHIDYVMLVVEDNGIGMTEEIIDIINSDEIISSPSKKGNGIGVKNVKNRLEFFYHTKDLFKVESQLNEWTKIQIKLPRVYGNSENNSENQHGME